MEALSTREDYVITERHLQNHSAIGSELEVLTHIFEPRFNLAVWQRPASALISDYLLFALIEIGIKGVVNVQNVTALLQDALPHVVGKEDGREALIDDIALQVDMLICLVGCNAVGLRFTPLKAAMCPKFHVDKIQIRQICTYKGPATEWLSNHVARREFLGAREEIDAKRLVMCESNIETLNPFDIALLKGDAWEGNEDKGIIHRSPAIDDGVTRIVMTLDPM